MVAGVAKQLPPPSHCPLIVARVELMTAEHSVVAGAHVKVSPADMTQLDGPPTMPQVESGCSTYIKSGVSCKTCSCLHHRPVPQSTGLLVELIMPFGKRAAQRTLRHRVGVVVWHVLSAPMHCP